MVSDDEFTESQKLHKRFLALAKQAMERVDEIEKTNVDVELAVVDIKDAINDALKSVGEYEVALNRMIESETSEIEELFERIQRVKRESHLEETSLEFNF